MAATFVPYQNEYTPAAFADTVLTPDSIRARMDRMRVLVASPQGEVIGTVAGAEGQAGQGHLRGMAVSGVHRGTGVAARLRMEIETWLVTQG